MTRTSAVSIALATVALAAVGLVGCSAPTSVANTSSKSVTADKPTETTTPTPSADAEKSPHFGQTVTYDGLEVSIGAPQPFTPSEFAAGGTQPNNVKLDLTVKNTGTKPYDPSGFYITASSAGTEAQGVFDTENNLSGSPSTSVLPGATVTWTQAFNVANPSQIVMDVTPGFDYQKSTWTN